MATIEEMTSLTTTRRQLIRTSGLVTATAALAPRLLWASTSRIKRTAERSLHLYNIHTGEFFKGAYWEKGAFIADALQELNHFLRDRRTGQVTDMSQDLINLLHTVSQKFQVRKPLEIVCGYRAAKTNERLHRQNRGVAKHSRHITGEAVDFYVPGVKLHTVRDVVRSLRAGGVGYYPRSGFVHMDIRQKPAYWGA